jgi:hypothetical protein
MLQTIGYLNLPKTAGSSGNRIDFETAFMPSRFIWDWVIPSDEIYLSKGNPVNSLRDNSFLRPDFRALSKSKKLNKG